MAMNIKNDKTEKLARELSELTGESRPRPSQKQYANAWSVSGIRAAKAWRIVYCESEKTVRPTSRNRSVRQNMGIFCTTIEGCLDDCGYVGDCSHPSR